MTLIADVFPKLPAPKNVVRSMLKNLCFRGPFDRQHDKWLETVSKFERSTFKISINHCESSCIGKDLF